MLRITKLSQRGTDVTLKLEGRLASDWVTELETQCRHLLAEGRRVRLDFEDVTFVDARGARALNELACEELKVVNCRVLVGELLHGGGLR